MPSYRFAKFEVSTLRHLLRLSMGASLLVGLGEPLLSGLARVLPDRSLQVAVRAWSSLTVRFLGLRIDTEGLEHVTSGPYVVAPLHEGFADALVLSRLEIPLRYVARDELFEWKQLGRFLRVSNQILVDPESPIRSLRSLLVECRRSIGQGKSIVIFPQGSILGIEAAFTTGAFRIADLLGVPVLPVVITGTHRVWEHPYTDRLRFGQRASVHVLPPLAAGEATESMRATERRMKRIALSDDTEPPRRFNPHRDGFWDGYRYEIDPDFPDVRDIVSSHRTR